MIIEVDAHYLMGKIKPDDTFYRVNQVSSNAYQDALLKYSTGEYFVFRTNAKRIKIRYKCHFHMNFKRFTLRQTIESSILGYEKSTNTWRYLNVGLGFLPEDGQSDDEFEINYIYGKVYDKYQVVLPELGSVSHVTIESNEPVEFEYVEPSIILLGSSVAKFCNSCTHMNLCAYMYRAYGLNVATVGISNCHTFQNEVLMDFLSKQKDKMMVVCDLEHCSEENYKNVEKLPNKPVYIVLRNLVSRWCEWLEANHPEIESFLPDGTWLVDAKHLNSYGIIEYSKMIMEKYEQYKMSSRITFVIPNRGGNHIDFIINQLKKFYPDEKYIVINQEDNEPFKRGQLFNVAYKYIDTDYICFIDNDIFFKKYLDLISTYEKLGCQALQPFNIIEQVEVDGDTYKVLSVSAKKVLGNDHRFGGRGGVTFVSREMYSKLNGFSSLLMGYGYEDNEFACRCDYGKFVNTDNVICHIKHPTRDTKNLHQQLNCVLFNNEEKEVHGGIDTTKADIVFDENRNGIRYIGATNIGTTNEKANELLKLHKPENIRVACEYMCDFYIKKYITSDYVLLGVPKHMNIGDTLIWEAEKELLDKLPYKRIATFFFGTYMHHIKITENDTIVFSGGGYLNDVWGGSLEYINTVLETFPDNKVVFLPNSVCKVNANSKAFDKFVENLKKRKIKPVVFSREYRGIKLSYKLFGKWATNILMPDVVLSWNVKSFMNKYGGLNNAKTGKTLFLDRKDKERIVSNDTFKYDERSDWEQMISRPAYADINMRCADWENAVKNRLIVESVNFVNGFDKVYSNRMHGAILAWLLGKETYLINNSYGKSKSLYETWLLDDDKIKMIE